MRSDFRLEHQFVDLVPRDLQERTLYISIEFATAAHKCFCGCGAEVVTPLSPVGWRVTFDGETVSLSPSVGSWCLKCKSHYWIRRNRVEWAGAMSPKEIEEVRCRDDRDRIRHYGTLPAAVHDVAPAERTSAASTAPKGLWAWLKGRFR